MSTVHWIQTICEVMIIALIIVGLIYEPVLVAWEDKQKEKVLKALKERKALRK
jgi:hypothetical protein